MRVLSVALLLALSVASATAHQPMVEATTTTSLRRAQAQPVPTTPAPARVVPVSEEAGTTYYICGTLDLSYFTTEIMDASNECAIKTSYAWTGSYLPTASERRELCSCTQLINKLQEVQVPHCSLYRDGSLISYAQLIRYAFGLCSVDGGGDDTTTTTDTPTTKTPSSGGVSPGGSSTTTTTVTTTEEESSSKAPLIGGIIGGIAVIALAVAAYVCGTKRRNNSAAAETTAANAGTGTSTTTTNQKTVPAHDYVEAMPLSPLESGTMTGTSTAMYSAMPRTPQTNTNTNDSQQQNRRSTGSKTQRSTMSGGGGARNSVGNSGGSVGTRGATSESGGLWEDPMIMAVRIPHDNIFFGPLLSRGGYGEVYKGTYKGETVAIKQLLPERRKDLVQIDSFLAEVKLLASLDHERIVKFIGVAWNSLSDACAVVEYMPNGDLRGVLSRWQYGEEQRPQGFDADKAKIALHVAHALTYLHSLQPVIVHRDLKSKNILLNEDFDAKLTDFGVSRVRADSTMTAGVGSSLWMAPEVMMGERYNEKADIFSFGVVLSELDTHELPYSHAKENGSDRKIVDSAILQMVTLGRLTIEFSEHANEELVKLGRECVLVDPTKRPTAGEVLYRVHQVQRQLSS